MDAMVTAGGIPKEGEHLYELTQGKSKALLDVAGKPMAQWILDALGGAKHIQRVVVVGLDESSGLTCEKELHFIPNQGSMVANIRGGTQKLTELDPGAKYVMVVSSDIPAITSEMVDWTIDSAMETKHDMYYNVVPRAEMEKRYPGSKRTYTKLKGLELSGGDMNVVATWTVTAKDGLWNRLEEARKSPLKTFALVGLDTFLLILFRRLDLDGAAKQVSKRLGIACRAILCPYAEIAMDVDKSHQLEILQADLAKQN